MRYRRAFTLIEMMIVLSIALILMGIGVAGLGAIRTGTKIEAGINTVSAAVSVCRAYVDRERTDNTDPLAANNPQYMGGTAGDPNIPVGGKFGGVAVVITPDREIRLVRHARGASNGPDILQAMVPERFGFEDIPERDYIDLPAGCVIVGIGRDSGGAPQFLEPPFAIRFDANGSLVTSTDQSATPDTIDRMVIYDGDYDGAYEDGDRRSGAGHTLASHTPTWDSTTNRYEVPFERLETVVGVRIIDAQMYDAASPDRIVATAPRSGGVVTDTKVFRDIFFSRYTGAPLRNR